MTISIRHAKARHYGKPVIYRDKKGKWRFILAPFTSRAVVAGKDEYLAMLNAIDGRNHDLDEAWNEAVKIIMRLIKRSPPLVHEVEKILHQYRVNKLVDLPRHQLPAIVWDLKQLEKELSHANE